MSLDRTPNQGRLNPGKNNITSDGREEKKVSCQGVRKQKKKNTSTRFLRETGANMATKICRTDIKNGKESQIQSQGPPASQKNRKKGKREIKA